MVKNKTIHDEIMSIVNLLIEEKKIINKIEQEQNERVQLLNKVRDIDKSTELGNVKALKLHKEQLEGAGKLIIKEEVF